MVNYNNSTVYKLHSYDNDLIYIGSTTQPLAKRLYEHKHKSNTCSSKILFEQSDNVIITAIETVNVNCKMDLLKIERLYIENMECVNKCIPLRTQREYRHDNLDQYKQRNKQYYIDNLDKIKEYNKQYQIINKDKIKQYRIDNNDKEITRHKKYYEKNKDAIAVRKKQYILKNKDQYKQKYKQYYIENKDVMNKNKRAYDKFRRSPTGLFLRCFNFSDASEV